MVIIHYKSLSLSLMLLHFQYKTLLNKINIFSSNCFGEWCLNWTTSLTSIGWFCFTHTLFFWQKSYSCLFKLVLYHNIVFNLLPVFVAIYETCRNLMLWYISVLLDFLIIFINFYFSLMTQEYCAMETSSSSHCP